MDHAAGAEASHSTLRRRGGGVHAMGNLIPYETENDAASIPAARRRTLRPFATWLNSPTTKM
jgi:hypothetical protein